MHCRLDDDDVLNTINVSSHSYAASTPSQEYEQPECEDVLDNDDEGFVPRGRAANYNMGREQVNLCGMEEGWDARGGGDRATKGSILGSYVGVFFF
jgi:hypothetical protein